MNQLIERVHPCLVSNDSFLANINGVLNAIVIDAMPVGKSVLQGEGAGAGPTSSALISDLCSILRGNIKYPFGIPDIKRKKVKVYKNPLTSAAPPLIYLFISSMLLIFIILLKI